MNFDLGSARGGWPVRVRPRVFAPNQSGGATVRIEEAVCEAVAVGTSVIRIAGGPGSGRTTAIAYLQGPLDDLALEYFDGARDMNGMLRCLEQGRVAVVVGEVGVNWARQVTLTLAPWGEEELFEWAIGEPVERRRGFVERALRATREFGPANAEVFASIWKEMAEDESIQTLEAALAAALRKRAPIADRALEVAGHGAWWLLLGRESLFSDALADFGEMRRLVRHGAVALFAASRWAAEMLAAGSDTPLLHMARPLLVDAVARRLAEHAGAMAFVRETLRTARGTAVDAMGASLLRMAGDGWRPQNQGDGPSWNFGDAILTGANWARVNLHAATLSNADLSCADLWRSHLSHVRGDRTRMVRANCGGTSLYLASFREAELAGTSFHVARIGGATFAGCDLACANFRQASGVAASFVRCDLAGANFEGASLAELRMARCDLTGTSFRGARLERAKLLALDFRAASLDDVDLSSGRVRACVLSEVVATGIDAHGTMFVDCDLTGSVFRSARLAEAKFRGCGLAEVWWQGADLRGADFTGSTFHMGSSRSGLVGSVIAGEGSRTGFYTDDYGAQNYKPPEEISKADLRGADLRGAIVQGVDFYLVDLRGAIYDAGQAEWFRKCGAILMAQA